MAIRHARYAGQDFSRLVFDVEGAGKLNFLPAEARGKTLVLRFERAGADLSRLRCRTPGRRVARLEENDSGALLCLIEGELIESIEIRRVPENALLLIIHVPSVPARMLAYRRETLRGTFRRPGEAGKMRHVIDLRPMGSGAAPRGGWAALPHFPSPALAREGKTPLVRAASVAGGTGAWARRNGRRPGRVQSEKDFLRYASASLPIVPRWTPSKTAPRTKGSSGADAAAFAGGRRLKTARQRGGVTRLSEKGSLSEVDLSNPPPRRSKPAPLFLPGMVNPLTSALRGNTRLAALRRPRRPPTFGFRASSATTCRRSEVAFPIG